MYNNQQIAFKIKQSAKDKKITIKQLLEKCNLNVNYISQFANGKDMTVGNLYSIADYLGVSIDYLLGRTDTPTEYSNGINNVQTTVNSPQVSGNNNSNINTGNVGNSSNVNTTTANNNSLDDTTIQIATAFQNMSLADKAKVITLIAELTEKNKTA